MSKPKNTNIIFSRLIFKKTHWTIVCCLIATSIAAVKFGDKAYFVELSEMHKNKDYKQLINNITEILQSPEAFEIKEYYLQDMYNLLASAKASENYPVNEITNDYINAIGCRENGNILLWVLKNNPPFYAEAATKVLKTKNIRLQNLLKDYVKAKQWGRFLELLDKKINSYANIEKNEHLSITNSIYSQLGRIDKDEKMSLKKKFRQHCLSNSKLIGFSLAKTIKVANEYEKKGNFAAAINVYRQLLTNGENFDTSAIEMKLSELMFEVGQYSELVAEADRFIEKYKPINGVTTKEMIMLKGRSLIQLGEIDKAINVFLSMIVEYPETAKAPESSFFIGYCYMLQGKFGLAKEALNIVITTYPNSGYASKAKLCLHRIESLEQ